MTQIIQIPRKTFADGSFYHSDLQNTKLITGKKIQTNTKAKMHNYVVVVPKNMRHLSASGLFSKVSPVFFREGRNFLTYVYEVRRLNRSSVSVTVVTVDIS